MNISSSEFGVRSSEKNNDKYLTARRIKIEQRKIRL